MLARHYVLLLCLLLAAHLCGCRTARPQVDERPNAAPVPTPVGLASDTTRTPVRVALAPALLPRLTDALGLSTPAGRARRQARKDLAAATPHDIKVKDGAFSWGGDAIAIGKKAGPAIVKSDSATQQVATNAVAGHHNTATQTATSTPAASRGLFGRLKSFLGNLGDCLLLALGALLVLAILFRKRLIPGFPF